MNKRIRKKKLKQIINNIKSHSVKYPTTIITHAFLDSNGNICNPMETPNARFHYFKHPIIKIYKKKQKNLKQPLILAPTPTKLINEQISSSIFSVLPPDVCEKMFRQSSDTIFITDAFEPFEQTECHKMLINNGYKKIERLDDRQYKCSR